MVEERPTIGVEDISIDEARRIGRSSRMEPQLYDTLRNKIQSLSTEATRMHLGPEIMPERMKNYILRLA
jgi:hypothetical protein